MNNIADLRKRKKWSQSELAERLGVTQGAVSQWELEDAYPSFEKLFDLARALDVSIEKLYGTTVDELLKDVEEDCK